VALSAFDDKEKQPETEELAAVLGRSGKAWERLVAHLAEAYSPLTEKWGFSGEKWGWSLRLIQKKRTILYMTPAKKFFYVGFALGEKAVKKAVQAGLSHTVLEVIEKAPKYAEGRGVRLEVRVIADLVPVERIAEAKMST
jgi:hypothetical protein